ncbi:MAG: N-acetylmuramoyl-L-alanine amidase [Acidaminococcaceae bacterium]
MRTDLIDYNLQFRALSPRPMTDMLVIHHTGNPSDDDLSAAEIHDSHLAQGWAGIGYHFVIRKSGQVEIGRPSECLGAHAYGENNHTISILVCGNFEIAAPTDAQVESLAKLIADLTEIYGLQNTSDCAVGHRDLMPTACPGQNLYSLLQTVLGKAEWYHLNT